MESIQVTIQDEIRDERVAVSLRVTDRIGDVIQQLIDMFHLPRYTFTRQEIYYDLYRQEDASQPLAHARTVGEFGIVAGSVLRLVSPEGRHVWRQIQDLIDEIKDQIKDQIEDQVKDWIEEQLEKLRRTEGEKEKVRQLEEKYRNVAGKGAGKPVAKSGPKVTPFGAVAAVGGIAVGGVALIAAGVFALSVLGIIDLSPGSGGGSVYVPPAEPGEDEGADPDGDGLDTGDEYNFGTDPYNPDTDEDGLWDGDERFYATDPLWWDTDGDDYGDGDEVNNIGSDPLDPNDPGSPDDQDPDPDRDGLDTDYENEIGTDPFNPDTDEDGLWDGEELEFATDPSWWDTDGDEYGDGDEVHNIGSDPLDPNDPGHDDVGPVGDPFGESIFPLFEMGYTRFAILQVQNAPDEPVEIMAERIYEAAGEVVTYERFEGRDPYPAMSNLNEYEPEVVLLYAFDPATLKPYESEIEYQMISTGLDYAYFYAIFADGTGYEWHRP